MIKHRLDKRFSEQTRHTDIGTTVAYSRIRKSTLLSGTECLLPSACLKDVWVICLRREKWLESPLQLVEPVPFPRSQIDTDVQHVLFKQESAPPHCHCRLTSFLVATTRGLAEVDLVGGRHGRLTSYSFAFNFWGYVKNKVCVPVLPQSMRKLWQDLWCGNEYRWRYATQSTALHADGNCAAPSRCLSVSPLLNCTLIFGHCTKGMNRKTEDIYTTTCASLRCPWRLLLYEPQRSALGRFGKSLKLIASCYHPASYTVGTGSSFPRGKVRPGRDSDHSPPSSAEVKKE
jgi:hypothetical protein